MARQPYKKTHRHAATSGTLTITERRYRGGEKGYVDVERTTGRVQLWINEAAIIAALSGRALRSTSGVAKLVNGAIVVRCIDREIVNLEPQS